MNNQENRMSNEDIKDALKSYRKEHRLIMNSDGYNFIHELLLNKYIKPLNNDNILSIIDKAKELTDDDTHQAMEAVVHNLNSMHSRAGEIRAPEYCESYSKSCINILTDAGKIGEGFIEFTGMA